MNNKVEITQSHREEQGFSNISDDILRCADCGKSLVIVKKVKETTEENKFKAVCDYCGGSSFIKTIVGKIYVSPTENTALSNIDVVAQTDDGLGNIKRESVIYIKVKK